MTHQDLIDEAVRDLCSVEARSKSWTRILVEKLVKNIREQTHHRVIQDVLSGKVCVRCGGVKKPNPLSDICGKCFEEL